MVGNIPASAYGRERLWCQRFLAQWFGQQGGGGYGASLGWGILLFVAQTNAQPTVRRQRRTDLGKAERLRQRRGCPTNSVVRFVHRRLVQEGDDVRRETLTILATRRVGMDV
ncbi:hypothetical protein [Micromonospora sp. KC721]|uniref:hypothetical protein n=1 Tax=Micromonospora sp. KC721 TaxID=2530380 RepID=UPI0014050632|nr:hypothetical protein [Micromonospora sp. KC721]